MKYQHYLIADKRRTGLRRFVVTVGSLCIAALIFGACNSMGTAGGQTEATEGPQETTETTTVTTESQTETAREDTPLPPENNPQAPITIIEPDWVELDEQQLEEDLHGLSETMQDAFGDPERGMTSSGRPGTGPVISPSRGGVQ